MQYFRITYPNMVTITPSLLYAFVVFLCMAVGISGQYAKFSKLDLPQGVTGPESAAFRGIIFPEGPFTTVTDGRILKWQGPNVGFVDFAYTSPTRSCFLHIYVHVVTYMNRTDMNTICSCPFVHP
ncbi:putative strictosidine synthase [Helianthus annuus]|nr:putative strictosidine synthase [Helianthus annuus]KAJ0543941.1 putative strictosidine synthase [Helianthus annuus]KAJ0708997.1 putative strictosidine synthase [Helianthus annuus]KAJ0712868.1 putative strictosidine synthase [Helianthus annuus]